MILERKQRIAGYCRISVDDELDRDNTSIENVKVGTTQQWGCKESPKNKQAASKVSAQ